MSDRVLVIVPTYNEVENVERILDRLRVSVPTAHALVVDDGSPDGTIVRSSALFTPAVFVEEIAQRDSTTVAQRLGAAPEWALAAVGGMALLAALRRGRGRR